eukprot:CAMPEP_0197626870 /NCGR_PEP_ID=MMETSP1338-20131121/5650_1 /TAXON_ID=43686 ORGANISM="Pelagodinium beii, Strain RCC1491" /NCGR_SAMPLE_ID=MMETSP1338 /ASSEMBLY_ACC=CAM_ASM_000754 /LENGTH=426 /DNA_ID=CAMNT_0043197453 /DNA_START=53 /DNA_END=1333 /DNA_ORIENTATION=-
MAKVTAYVYDITQGMAAQMSEPLIGKKLDFVPHTGIAVFGKEYFFGGGPAIGEPGKSVPVPVAQVLELGETAKSMEELEKYINDVLALEHNEQNYNLLNHNCNHYADAVAKFLLNGKGLPESIVNIAQEALSTPQGQVLRGMIENMERSMRQGAGGAGGLNPFGNVPPAMPSVPAAAPAAAPAAGSNAELDTALAELASSNSEEARRAALGMLIKLTENVEKNPAETKFRRIKMENAAFKKKIGTAAGGVEVMVAAGWLPDVTPEGEDAWVMHDDAAGQQASIRKCLEAEMAKLPALLTAAPATTAATPAPAAGGYGGMPGMGNPGGLGGFPGMPGGMGGGMPGGLGGMAGNPMMQQQMQQMMQNPAAMQQAMQMMQNNPQMQQMMQDPQMMAQAQQMMQNPQAMQQAMQMMQNGGFPGMGPGGGL